MTKLVPVKLLKRFQKFNVDEVVGFSEDVAAELVEKKAAVLVDVKAEKARLAKAAKAAE